jgi:regulator of RNase E activity RraA
VRWNCEVEVFGTPVKPGQLVHADKHGFLAVPAEDEARLLEAALFMDGNECDTEISVARSAAGKTAEQLLSELDEGGQRFRRAAMEKFGRTGEW